MTTVEDHYENLLASHYTWMCGGLEQNVGRCRRFFERVGITPRGGRKALDLGCGSGFQSRALAELGFEVFAVDSSAILLGELRESHGQVTAIRGDMRDRTLYESLGPFEVACCMGDSLTHLQSFGEVVELVKGIHASLADDAVAIIAFRSLMAELEGVDRIIPVRSDESRVMTTFLEFDTDHVNVHDMIHVRGPQEWVLHKSAYRKLRLSAGRVQQLLEQVGFGNVSRTVEEGLATIVARK